MSKIDQSSIINSLAPRRNFLRGAGLATVATLAAGGLPLASAKAASGPTMSDVDILNFALNLEYLEAEYYLRACEGTGLSSAEQTGTGTQGAVTGGRKVSFSSATVRGLARSIAEDERQHVVFLRKALGSSAVAQPAINFTDAFNTLAKAAGLISGTQTFDPFANDINFLLGAFIFEDVGVTAYHGAAPLFSNAELIGYATGICAIEAYHAGAVRSMLYGYEEFTATAKIAALRETLDGTKSTSEPDDSGVLVNHTEIIAPNDSNGIAFSRNTSQVLNIVYGNAKGTKGLFFPHGVNGAIQ